MKIAVITGASSGIGRQFALDTDRNETLDEIWLIARDRAELTRTADAMRTKTRIIPLDLAEQESIDSLYRLLGETQPEIEILVNAAGFGKIGASDVIGRRGHGGHDQGQRSRPCGYLPCMYPLHAQRQQNYKYVIRLGLPAAALS